MKLKQILDEDARLTLSYYCNMPEPYLKELILQKVEQFLTQKPMVIIMDEQTKEKTSYLNRDKLLEDLV